MASSFDDIARQMAEVGIFVPERHQLHVTAPGYDRFRPDGQRSKKKSAWYRIYENRTLKGRVFYSGSFGIRTESYLIKPGKETFTEEEKAEAKEFAKKAAEQFEKDRQAMAAEAAARAARLWKMGHDVDGKQGYLTRKGIKPYGARQLNNQLLVPMFRAGQLVGLQTISPVKDEDGRDKTFMLGSQIAGAYMKIGDFDTRPDLIYVVEGYATGCSVHEATGAPVVVAFNAGNLDSVTATVRKKYDQAKVVIAGDDDHFCVKRAKEFFEKTFGVTPVVASSVKDPEETFTHPEKGEVAYKCFKRITDGVLGVYGYARYVEKGRKVTKKLSFVNAGKSKAMEAARKHRCCVVFPRFKAKDSTGSDFNDLAQAEGLEVAAEQLKADDLKPLASREAGEKAPGFMDERIRRMNEHLVYVYPVGYWDTELRELVGAQPLKDRYDDETFKNWKKNPARRVIMKDQLLFEPGRNVPEGCINMFDGWPLKPDSSKACDLIIENLFDLCGRDDDVFWWVAKWLAYPLQHPGAKMHQALLVHGAKEGTGKSFMFEVVMREIYGRYGGTINQDIMDDKYTTWQSQKLFILGEEIVSSAERRKQKNLIKTWITGKYHQVVSKYVNSREEVNLTNFVFLSNELQPLVLDEYDRRFMVIYNDIKHDQTYFKNLAEQVDAGGVEGFYDWLLHIDLGDFGPDTPVLETEAHQALKSLGKASDARFLDDWLSESLDYPVGPVAGIHLYAAYDLWRKKTNERPVTQTAFLTALGRKMRSERRRVDLYPENEYYGPDKVVTGLVTEKRMLTVYFPVEKQMDANEVADSVRAFQLKMLQNRQQYHSYGG